MKKLTRSAYEAKIRLKYESPIEDPVAEAAKYLGGFYGDALDDEEVRNDIRATAGWNNLVFQRYVRALKAVLAMDDDQVDFVHLVGWIANQGLPEHTIAASRAWLKDALTLLENVLNEFEPDTIEGFVNKYGARYGFLDEP